MNSRSMSVLLHSETPVRSFFNRYIARNRAGLQDNVVFYFASKLITDPSFVLWVWEKLVDFAARGPGAKYEGLAGSETEEETEDRAPRWSHPLPRNICPSIPMNASCRRRINSANPPASQLYSLDSQLDELLTLVIDTFGIVYALTHHRDSGSFLLIAYFQAA